MRSFEPRRARRYLHPDAPPVGPAPAPADGTGARDLAKALARALALKLPLTASQLKRLNLALSDAARVLLEVNP